MERFLSLPNKKARRPLLGGGLLWIGALSSEDELQVYEV
jgi:hypothetical protein